MRRRCLRTSWSSLVEALLAGDDELFERQGVAYDNAVNQTWPDRMGMGDALSLFVSAAVQAREIKRRMISPQR
jgi:hypothetical protein